MLENSIKTKEIPHSPGVYFFKDQKGRVLYIGKAADLKNRLNSYLSKREAISRGPLIAKMLDSAEKLEWKETDSEVEALILESQLIKKYQPDFNIMLRDDKKYFYVGFTKEEFPHIFLTHQPVAPKFSNLKAEYIGPFTEGTSLKSTLKLLRKIFPYCTCKQKHNRFCLNYHIGNCVGFCCLKNPNITKGEEIRYKQNIKALKSILNGNRVSVLENLEKKMNKEAQSEHFEKAIDSRNKLAKLQQVFENAKVIKELSEKSKASRELAKILNTADIPYRIEGYDISNIQGQFATGSMVVFINGQPEKSEYRKFKIRTVSPESGGDVAMLKEMLKRRFNHPEWQLPDLILVDGGKPQLNTARSIIPGKINIVALTKNERHVGDHIYTGTNEKAIAINDLPSGARHLIFHIDAEAHRFAISYYRKLHRQEL